MSFYVRYSGPRVKTSNEHLYVNFWSVRNAACKGGAQPLHWRTDYDSRAERARLQGGKKAQGCGGSRITTRQLTQARRRTLFRRCRAVFYCTWIEKVM